jgi:hypothetical protein
MAKKKTPGRTPWTKEDVRTALSRSRTLLVNPAARSNTTRRKINQLAAPIHRERCFSEIFVRRDFGCGSSFGFFTA